MKSNRPPSINWFERFFFASFVVSFADIFVHRDTYFSDEELGDDLGFTFILAMSLSVIASFGIQIALWFFITHRAKNWARWVYVIFWAAGAVLLFAYIFDYSTSELVFLTITQLFALGSVICLFTPQARFWFKTKGQLPAGQEDELSDIFQ